MLPGKYLSRSNQLDTITPVAPLPDVFMQRLHGSRMFNNTLKAVIAGEQGQRLTIPIRDTDRLGDVSRAMVRLRPIKSAG